MELGRLAHMSALHEGPELELLRKQLEEFEDQFDKCSDFLNEMAQRVGQDSPEFDHGFAEWLHLKDEYENLFDQIIRTEARIDFAEWLATLPPPKASVRSTNGRKQS
jgi:hypothetical protein